MKYLLFIFAVLSTSMCTCFGRNLTRLHIVFVNNMVNPDEQQISQLSYLMTYPYLFVDQPEYSSLLDVGLIEKYSLICSSRPDKITTLSFVGMLKPLSFWSNSTYNYLAKTCTTQFTLTAKAASLKGLRKALDISSNPSVIFLVTNTNPEDTNLLPGILKTMVNKSNLVYVLRIDNKKTSSLISQLISTNKTTDNLIEIWKTLNKQDNDTLGEEYTAIMEITNKLLASLTAQVLSDKLNHTLQVKFQPGYVANLLILMEVYHLSHDEYLARNVSKSMESDSITYFNKLKEQSSNGQFSVAFPTKQGKISWNPLIQIPGTPKTIETSANYTAKDFQKILRSQNTNFTVDSSLKSLLKELQTIPVSSWIVYYFDREPEDSFDVLYEVVQLIRDKRIKITFRQFGNNSMSSGELPLMYRTIKHASLIARSGGPRVWTNWITPLVIFVGLVISRHV